MGESESSTGVCAGCDAVLHRSRLTALTNGKEYCGDCTGELLATSDLRVMSSSLSPEELRALDAWIAEHLFWWEYVPKLATHLWGGFWRSPDGERHARPYPDSWSFIGEGAYSSSWEGAGQVLEAMAGRGWSYKLEGDSDGVRATFYAPLLSMSAFRTSTSLPLAICLAAKAALSEEAGK